MIYSKKTFTIDEHIAQLVERGLTIKNIDEAKTLSR
jgi:hypothetical protein